jgi:hypothetical protein
VSGTLEPSRAAASARGDQLSGLADSGAYAELATAAGEGGRAPGTAMRSPGVHVPAGATSPDVFSR